MSEITLTVNGKKVKGEKGNTVLEVCQANGIDVPTLCHLAGLSDVGACRMCVVEIEKERRPVPSCTYPARDGLVVQTNTERLEKYRRQILELIFTEHNHFCMFCEASGDCELQKLAYRYQMDNVRYPYTFPSLSVDSLSDYLVIDHNRCILCGRCVRACSEIAAGYTLNFSHRGWKEAVSADLEQPLGESSCLSCGACVQACPTGAIFSKLSLYKGSEEECQRIPTVCPNCGVGCKISVLVKDNNLVKIEAPDLTGDSRGVLCRLGRFGLLQATPPRVTSPLVRDSEGELRECSLDEAIAVIVRRLAETNGEAAGLIATRLPSETLSLFREFMTSVIGSDAVDTLDGEAYRLIRDGISQFSVNGRGLDIECPIEEIGEADCITVVGADPQETNPIISTLVRRAVSQRKAKLIVVNSSRDVFPLWSDLWLKPKAGSDGALLKGLAKAIVDKGLATPERMDAGLIALSLDKVSLETGVDRGVLESAAEIYAKASCGIIIYGEGLLRSHDAGSVAKALKLAEITGRQNGDRLRVISLKSGANSRGAWELGLAKGIKNHKPKMLYLLLADEPESEELLRKLRGVDFLVAQTSYYSPVVYMADVILPSPIWAERDGRYVSLDGRVQEFERVLKPKEGMLQDSDILMEIAKKLGQTLS
jgi:NADH dehydrogenase/NADH:ubiquinone oxidoreductase subunit G